jgi:hypothetical protein
VTDAERYERDRERLRSIARQIVRQTIRLCACDAMAILHVHPDGTCPLPRIPRWNESLTVMVPADLSNMQVKVVIGDGLFEVRDAEP